MTLREFKAWFDGFNEHVCEKDGPTKEQYERIKEKLQQAVNDEFSIDWGKTVTRPYTSDGTDGWTSTPPQQYPGSTTIGDPYYGQTITTAETSQAGRDPTGC